MASFNKVILMGNLTRTPELRYTPGGQAVCEMGLAVNRKFSANGQDKEEVCFVDIVVWAKQAESCGKYLQKGSAVLVEGRLQYDAWEDKEGKRRSRLRVTAERVQFLSSRSNDSTQNNNTGNTNNYSQNRPQQPNGYQGGQNTQNNNVGNTGGYNSNKNYQQPVAPTYQNEPMPPPPPKVFDNDEPEDDIPF